MNAPVLQHLDLLATAPGGVARLRELILSLAVQGKLAPQDPADEPAGVLLRKIRAEKDRLVAEGKVKRDKPLAEIAEEEKPFELPVGWEWVRIPEVTHNLGQGEPTGAFSYIDVASVDNAKGCVASEIQVLEAVDAPSRARKNVALGTVIYSTIRPYLKNIAVIERDYSPRAIASTAFAVMHPHSGVLPKYLMHYLRSQSFTDYVNSKAAGIAYPAINDANFFQGLIALPPEAEQSRIVARVEALMRLCDALEEKGRLEAAQHAQLVSTLLGLLAASTTPEEVADHWQRVALHFDGLLDRPEAVDALEQTLLQLAVRGLLVPQDPADEPASALLQTIRAEKDRLIAAGQIKRDKALPPIADEEMPFALPLGWEWVTVSEVCSVVTDGEHATPERCEDSSQVPLVTAKNVRSETMDYSVTDYVPRAVAEQCWKRCKPEAGDVLMVSVGATLGRLSVLRDTVDMVLVRSVTVLRPVHVGIDASYLALHLMSPQTQNEIWGSVKQSAQPCLYLAKSAALKIALPPLAEQSRIVARVTALRRLCADLRQRLAEGEATQARLAEALLQAA